MIPLCRIHYDTLSSVTGDIPNESYWSNMDVRSFAPRPILRLLTYRFAPVPTLSNGSDIVYSSCSALSVCCCYSEEYTGDVAGCQAFWDENFSSILCKASNVTSSSCSHPLPVKP